MLAVLCDTTSPYNGAQWYKKFLQVGWLDLALILLGLSLSSEHLCVFGPRDALMFGPRDALMLYMYI